jgi:eukaryotic-like serine/threonine-protein kinase
MDTKLSSGAYLIAYSSDSTYLIPGRVLHGRYYVENVIGTTTYHTIYGGVDLSTGNNIVIKYAHHATCSYGAHGVACRRLVSEGMMLLLLKSKKIPAPHFRAQLHADSRPYLVMTRIPGQTLASLHQEGQLRPRQTLHYAIQLCPYILGLHQIGYVHHDIKPANIIIDPDDSPVLIDWGAARRIRAAGEYGTENLGTPGYLSPEQARGEAQPGNDIFALAMTLDELIPVQGRHLEGIIRRATLSVNKRYATTVDFQRALSRLTLLDQLVSSLGLSAI